MTPDRGSGRGRQSHADVAQELYFANLQLLGWAHSIVNAESPDDGKAGLLKVGDNLDTWPRVAAKEIQLLRARIGELEEALRGLLWAAQPVRGNDRNDLSTGTQKYRAALAALSASPARPVPAAGRRTSAEGER